MSSYKIDGRQFKKLVSRHYETKVPMMCYGGFGIGKSAMAKQECESIAKTKKKEFIDWNRTTSAKRKAMFDKPEDYFVFVDIRLSQNDNTDLKGLPKFDGEGESVEWKLPNWISYLSRPEADGILFFDEINLAPPSVLASAYQILHDRCMGETKLSDQISIIAAGNRAEDRAHTFDMPMPLQDRMSEVELEINSDRWFEWALIGGGQIDPRIVAFLKFKQTLLNKISKDGKTKPVTPRGWERVSTLIKGLSDKDINDVAAAGIGEATAIEFCAFNKLKQNVDLKGILKNPKLMEKYQKLDMRYSIMAGIAELYNNDKKIFEECLDLCEVVEPDFGVLLLQLMKGNNPTHFKTSILKSKKGNSIIERFFKYFY